ncbi:hypothetical protein [Flavilitoribacter nigricans]|uniref:Uncharacterized protein n=1 Tax=Flavilitoribacter nigricans (strain ATCC 23147 / DSM 23189 / NBRC 102662 / NCIMB 1420 / SS-2) TaxID=1122177 RepID=A0A2D0N2R8_FLAN2|nr:hypothetical protein [Flavilitoribacter nigricans]PHN02033.1 hypothetical protein CRP01_33905 [Flavilitoribacter nigricans DSM 23189 = NBRC 102662]
MTTRLQTALARREQLKKTKAHLQELDQRLEQIQLTVGEINEQIDRNASPLQTIAMAIGRTLVTADGNSPEAIAERDHQLLLQRKRLQDEMEMLHFEKEILEEQLSSLPEVEREIEHLKSVRESQLLHCSDEQSELLRDVYRRQSDLHDFRQQIQLVVISGSRASAQLLTLAHQLQKLAEAGGLYLETYITENGDTFATYDYLDRLKSKVINVGQLFPKYDADVFELYRLSRARLPEAPERFFRFGPAYFNSLLYRGEMQNDFHPIYLELIELWRRVNASVTQFKNMIRQIQHQIDYLDTKKDQLLENV